MNPVLLPQASTQARVEDRIFFTLLVLSGAVALLVLVLVIGFSIRYRAGSKAPRGPLPTWVSREFEVGWTSATLIVFVFLFWWTISSQLKLQTAPADAFEIHVVAKQWMWEAQQPNGLREINTVHAPVGVPVKLVMASQDVIHSFSVPAFRLKQDVLPGRYTQLWFQATREGTFPLFCDQYCGLDHAAMIGQVIVMSQADYARWAAAEPQGDSLAAQGRAIFVASGCGGCHGQGATVRAPDLSGLYGARATLASGEAAVVDEGFLHDQILNPRKAPIAGYDPVMPGFQGVLSEAQLVPLIAYIKSLKAPS